MSSTTGKIFRVTTFGESHGAAVGAVVDGCPAGLKIDPAAVQRQLDRRRPGQSDLNTPRREPDRVAFLSGLQDEVTLGTPIALLVHNRDRNPGDYRSFDPIPRPSHADYTYQAKYGIRARSGGGRASARETIGRVAAGSIAETLLQARGVEIVAWVSAVGDVEAGPVDSASLTRTEVDATPVRCPDPAAARAMRRAIETVRDENDSIGGIVTAVCRHVPAGWGEPVFDKLEAALAGAMLSIPAARGFDIGAGFAAARMRGSRHNDPFRAGAVAGSLETTTNHSGGIQGGISNGQPILFRVAFKPAATIGIEQATADYDGVPAVLKAGGRHDPCVLPRAVPIVEAMAALVLADAALLQARMAAP